MKNVFFGLGLQYDSGDEPAIAMNRHGRIVEVHKNEFGATLYYHTGNVNQMTVNWGQTDGVEYADGEDPSVALNSNDRVVEVHQNGLALFSRTGTLVDHQINWDDEEDEYTDGLDPSVAVNDAGKVVEVHRSQQTTRLYYRFGKLDGTNVDWKWDDNYDNGDRPQVAINNDDWVVEVHKSELGDDDLWYHVGRINEEEEKIEFGDSIFFATGSMPTVALTDDGDVVVSWSEATGLAQANGELLKDEKKIKWISAKQTYDEGNRPRVAAAGKLAIVAHEGDVKQTLWYSTSLITDRAIWMMERRSLLGPRKIPQLVFPASHDSAMYLYGLATLGKTQTYSIFDQLEYGIRYFDLRPQWTGSKFVIQHGGIDGPDLSVVLDDIAKYCNFGHQELVILDWGEFRDFDDDLYRTFAGEVAAKIGRWQFQGPLQPEQRLRDIPFSQYTESGPCIISAIEGDWAITNPKAGFWVFRKCDDLDSNEGDLVVYDRYSNTSDYQEMSSDQFDKFTNYTGRQALYPLPCDMFLLSWTLTSPVGAGVWLISTAANRNLGNALPPVPNPNIWNQIINALYVDYVEFARVTDIGIIENELVRD